MGVNSYRAWGIFLISAGILWANFDSPEWAVTLTASQYRQLGLNYRQQERFPEAIAALEKSAAMEPNTANRVLLGWTQHLAGDRQAALDTLVKTVHQNPLDIPALNALGIVCLVNGNLPEAVIVHSWATLLKPQNEIAHYNLSLAYHRLQQYPWAIATAATAVRLEPENPHPLIAEAIAHWDSGNPTLAKARYAEAISLDPQYQDSSFLSHLQAAGFSPSQIETVEAVRTTMASR